MINTLSQRARVTRYFSGLTCLPFVSEAYAKYSSPYAIKLTACQKVDGLNGSSIGPPNFETSAGSSCAGALITSVHLICDARGLYRRFSDINSFRASLATAKQFRGNLNKIVLQAIITTTNFEPRISSQLALIKVPASGDIDLDWPYFPKPSA